MARPTRELITLLPSTTPTFSLLGYNILSKNYSSPPFYKKVKPEILDWKYRRGLILKELREFEAEVICLQEVDKDDFPELLEELSDLGYDGVYYHKASEERTIDGCATLFKKSIFRLIDKRVLRFDEFAKLREDLRADSRTFGRLIDKDNIAVVTLFEHLPSATRILIVNPHLYWDPRFCDVKVVQSALLLDELGKLVEEYRIVESEEIPIIISGDFNSLPNSGVYELFTTGSLSPTHPDYLNNSYGTYTQSPLKYSFNLIPTYSKANQLRFTNYTENFKGVIDYCFVSEGNFEVTEVLGGINEEYLKKWNGFPNEDMPSDHIKLLSRLRLKLRGEGEGSE